MAKEKTVYVCTNCGQDSPKWVGKCPSCGAWNTYVEEIIRKEPANKRPRHFKLFCASVDHRRNIPEFEVIVIVNHVSGAVNLCAVYIDCILGRGCVHRASTREKRSANNANHKHSAFVHILWSFLFTNESSSTPSSSNDPYKVGLL